MSHKLSFKLNDKHFSSKISRLGLDRARQKTWSHALTRFFPSFLYDSRTRCRSIQTYVLLRPIIRDGLMHNTGSLPSFYVIVSSLISPPIYVCIFIFSILELYLHASTVLLIPLPIQICNGQLGVGPCASE